MVQYFLLKSDGDSDDPDLGLTSDTISSGGVLGGDNYTASHTASGSVASSIIQIFNTTNYTTATPSATAKQFDASVQNASVSTSVIVSALRDAFDAIDRTSVPEALTGASGGQASSTMSPLQSVSNALAMPLVATQTAAVTVQDGQSFGDAYADAIAATGAYTPTVSSGDAAVTALGQFELANATPQFDAASVEIFAFVSPETATATPQNATLDNTQVGATALTENAAMVPITPTTSLIISVGTTETGLEGAFADSLAADVGAQTSIKVAKTVANAEDQPATLDTTALPDALAAAVDAIVNGGIADTSVGAEALLTAAATTVFGTSSTQSGAMGTVADASATDLGSTPLAAALPDGAVQDAQLSELDASGDAHATPEVAATLAESLTEQGVVETQVEAAALVAQALTADQRTDDTAFTGAAGDHESFESTDLTGRPEAAALPDAVIEAAAAAVQDGEALTTATSLAQATDALADATDGDVFTVANVEGLVADAGMSPTEAVISLLLASLTGGNEAFIRSGQRLRLRNQHNNVEVLD